MYFDCLDRHLSVCSVRDLPHMARRDPGFWHVVSILEPSRRAPAFDGFRDVMPLRFDDVEDLDPGEPGCVLPRRDDFQKVFDFADERWSEPILIHCWLGQSRSTAMALAFLARGLHWDGVEDFAETGVDLLLRIRPKARPNVLVLQLGLQTFLPEERAVATAREMVNHPVLLENRFHPPSGGP